MRTIIAGAILLATIAAASAETRTLAIGHFFYAQDPMFGEQMQITACHHSSKEFNIIRRGGNGQTRFQDSIRVGVGDTFLIYDENTEGRMLSVDSFEGKPLNGCSGHFSEVGVD